MFAGDDLLLHFLDHEVLDLYNVEGRFGRSFVRQEAESVLRIGYLLTAGSLLLPLSSYFESPVARAVVDGCRLLVSAGDLEFIAGTTDYDAFLEAKREQYSKAPDRYPEYFKGGTGIDVRDLRASLRLRELSSTQDIAAGWKRSLEDENDVWKELVRPATPARRRILTRELLSIPERLDGAAFIWDFARPLLPFASIAFETSRRLQGLISHVYVESYLAEFDASIATRLRIGALDCGVGSLRQLPIDMSRRVLRLAKIERDIEQLEWAALVRVRYDPAFSLFARRVRSWIQECRMTDAAAALRTIATLSQKYTSPVDRVLGLAMLAAEGVVKGGVWGLGDAPGRSEESSYAEAMERVLFLKDAIENKGAHRIFYVDGQPVRKEEDLHILYRLTWLRAKSNASREVNDGRGPADFLISRGARDKTVVEFKLASNPHLKRNLVRQTEIYQLASDAGTAIEVVLFYSKQEEEHVRRILAEVGLEEKLGVVLIDARNDNKPSGSKA